MLKKIITVEGYELISIHDAMKLCGISSKRTLYNWMDAGLLKPKYHKDRIVLFDKKDVVSASNKVQKTKPRSGTPQEIGEGASVQG